MNKSSCTAQIYRNKLFKDASLPQKYRRNIMPEQNRNTPRLHQRGNPIANNPLMRRGGVHKKSRTSKRQKHKRETRQLVTKYMTSRHRGRSYQKRTRQNTSSYKKDHFMWSFFC